MHASRGKNNGIDEIKAKKKKEKEKKGHTPLNTLTTPKQIHLPRTDQQPREGRGMCKKKREKKHPPTKEIMTMTKKTNNASQLGNLFPNPPLPPPPAAAAHPQPSLSKIRPFLLTHHTSPSTHPFPLSTLPPPPPTISHVQVSVVGGGGSVERGKGCVEGEVWCVRRKGRIFERDG